jgi:hypothetical protein
MMKRESCRNNDARRPFLSAGTVGQTPFTNVVLAVHGLLAAPLGSEYTPHDSGVVESRIGTAR